MLCVVFGWFRGIHFDYPLYLRSYGYECECIRAPPIFDKSIICILFLQVVCSSIFGLEETKFATLQIVKVVILDISSKCCKHIHVKDNSKDQIELTGLHVVIYTCILIVCHTLVKFLFVLFCFFGG